TLRTAPLQSVQTVLATGSREVLLRDFEGERVYSVVRPLRQDGEIVGAIEVAQTLAFVEAEKRQTRERYIVSTALLAVAMTILILWLVQRLVARPLDRLVAAVRAPGGGELAHRLERTCGPGRQWGRARWFYGMC